MATASHDRARCKTVDGPSEPLGVQQSSHGMPHGDSEVPLLRKGCEGPPSDGLAISVALRDTQ